MIFKQLIAFLLVVPVNALGQSIMATMDNGEELPIDGYLVDAQTYLFELSSGEIADWSVVLDVNESANERILYEEKASKDIAFDVSPTKLPPRIFTYAVKKEQGDSLIWTGKVRAKCKDGLTYERGVQFFLAPLRPQIIVCDAYCGDFSYPDSVYLDCKLYVKVLVHRAKELLSQCQVQNLKGEWEDQPFYVFHQLNMPGVETDTIFTQIENWGDSERWFFFTANDYGSSTKSNIIETNDFIIDPDVRNFLGLGETGIKHASADGSAMVYARNGRIIVSELNQTMRIYLYNLKGQKLPFRREGASIVPEIPYHGIAIITIIYGNNRHIKKIQL